MSIPNSILENQIVTHANFEGLTIVDSFFFKIQAQRSVFLGLGHSGGGGSDFVSMSFFLSRTVHSQIKPSNSVINTHSFSAFSLFSTAYSSRFSPPPHSLSSLHPPPSSFTSFPLHLLLLSLLSIISWPCFSVFL